MESMDLSMASSISFLAFIAIINFDNTFLSTNYQFAKRKRKVVCIDISDNLVDFTVNGSSIKAINNLSNSYWGRFKVNLSEDLIIDKLSDVFIESIIINNPAQAN